MWWMRNATCEVSHCEFVKRRKMLTRHGARETLEPGEAIATPMLRSRRLVAITPARETIGRIVEHVISFGETHPDQFARSRLVRVEG